MDQKTKKVIIWAVVVILVFAAGFGSGYLFGKSRRAGGFPGSGGNFQGINGSVNRNAGNVQKQVPNQTQNQDQSSNQTPETQAPSTEQGLPTQAQ